MQVLLLTSGDEKTTGRGYVRSILAEALQALEAEDDEAERQGASAALPDRIVIEVTMTRRNDLSRAHEAAPLREDHAVIRLTVKAAPAGETDKPETEAPRRSAFEARVRTVIAGRLADETFSAQALAAAMEISYSHLHRRLRAEANLTPTQLIRQVRVEQAARLLEAGAGRVSEVAYAVGFASAQNLTRNFKKRFGKLPSTYF